MQIFSTEFIYYKTVWQKLLKNGVEKMRLYLVVEFTYFYFLNVESVSSYICLVYFGVIFLKKGTTFLKVLVLL